MMVTNETDISYEGCVLFDEIGRCYCSTGLPGTCKAPPVAYTVDHRKSDDRMYTYCLDCFEQIPDFLVRSCGPITEPEFSRYTRDVHCDGCYAALHVISEP